MMRIFKEVFENKFQFNTLILNFANGKISYDSKKHFCFNKSDIDIDVLIDIKFNNEIDYLYVFI